MAAIDLISKLLATENVEVIQGNFSTASFDCVKRILRIPVWDFLTKNSRDLLISHEVGHALYTPNDAIEQFYKNPKLKGCPFSILNIIEDIRIERMIQVKYPGLFRVYRLGYADLLKENLFKIQGKNLNKLSFFDRINIYAKTACSGECPIVLTAEEQIVYDKCYRANTFEEVIALVELLWEKHRKKPEKPKPKKEKKQEDPVKEDPKDEGSALDEDTSGKSDEDSTERDGNSDSDKSESYEDSADSDKSDDAESSSDETDSKDDSTDNMSEDSAESSGKSEAEADEPTDESEDDDSSKSEEDEDDEESDNEDDLPNISDFSADSTESLQSELQRLSENEICQSRTIYADSDLSYMKGAIVTYKKLREQRKLYQIAISQRPTI